MKSLREFRTVTPAASARAGFDQGEEKQDEGGKRLKEGAAAVSAGLKMPLKQR